MGKERDKKRKVRVDVFADEHIDDGHVLDYFLKYCEVECDWAMHEERDEKDVRYVLKLFADEHPAVAGKIKLD